MRLDFKVVDRQIVIFPGQNPKEVIIKVPGIEQVQQKGISGKVTDPYGSPLPGVTVVVKGTSQGTVTDADGNYTIKDITQDDILIFSFVGMKAQEVLVAGRSSIDIEMEEDAIGIEEVVAIGYGTIKKSDLTGAVSAVQGEGIAQRNTVKVSQALQGTMPGVMVTRSNGAADASSTIRIRGVTTIGDSTPLVIIDGIPGSIDKVNPNDIESISVLKDAASASIYGSRAASGVILITTKRGKEGQLNVNYNYEYTLDQPTRVAQFTDAVDNMKLSNERTWNDNDNIAGGEYNTYSEELIDNYKTLHNENPDEYPDTDWMGLLLKDYAPRERHSLGLIAGSKNIKTSFSLIYDKAEALYNNRSYDQVTMRSNNDVTINKFLTLQLNLNSIYSVRTTPIYDNSNTFSSYSVSTRPHISPVYAAVWSDGRIAAGKSGRNDYALLNYAGNIRKKENVLGGKVQLNFKPIEELTLSIAFSPELQYAKQKKFRKQLYYTEWDTPNSTAGLIEGATTTQLTESRNDYYSTTTQFLSNYIKTFNGHNLNLLAGFEEYQYFYESLGASRDYYNLTNYPYLDLGNENYQYNSGNAYENAYRSFFGRIMYNYNNKYFLQANARYDGSSRFDKDYRWGLFPSFSAGWVMSEESFMKDIEPLTFLKIRGSWGSLGNERIGNYQYQSTIGFGSTLLYQGDEVVSAQTAAIAKYAIRDLTWETTETYDFGVDASFFYNQLTFTGDFYKKRTKNMLLALEIPNYIGLDDPDQNTGNMHTTGWELSIGWSDVIGEIKYSIGANLSDSKSIMGDLGGTEFLDEQVKIEGSEYNEWYGYISEGLYQTQDEVDNSATTGVTVKPGDVRYKDVSGPEGVPDGSISSEYDRVLLGGSLPRYLYGGNINVKYKNFDLSLVFQGVGKQNSKITQYMLDGMGIYSDYPQIYKDGYWSKYNTDEQNLKAIFPRVTSTGRNNNYAASDFYLFNGAYFRLKNINIGYTPSKKLIEKCKLKDVRIYANISDLFSIDHFPKGWDPELSESGYWITRGFTLGISLTF